MVTAILRGCFRTIAASGLPLSMLDVGAGHDGYTELALAAGFNVTATEMSRGALSTLNEKFTLNAAFRGIFDPDGSLNSLGDERFSIIVCGSVLHHIPDYIAFMQHAFDEHLSEGGLFISFQDPLWYARVGPRVHAADRAMYLIWRLPRGNYRQGLSALWRRVTGRLSDTEVSDMSEYHVLRGGVDEVSIERLLSERFEVVSVRKYWSTQGALFQYLGTWLHYENTFLVTAVGFKSSQYITLPHHKVT